MSTEDPLSHLAPLLRVRPQLQELCRFGPNVVSRHEAEDVAQFHIVTRGACLLERPGHATLRLEAGDVLLLPRGDAHMLGTRAGNGSGARLERFAHGGLVLKTDLAQAVEAEILCGRLHFDAADAPLDLLPEVIVRAAGPAKEGQHARLVEAMRQELDLPRPGGLAIASDLASALFVMLLRDHLEQDPPAAGLLALLGHRGAARAVAAMVERPGADWTLDALAERAAMSRAALARLFRRLAGRSPMEFLADLRLGLAHRRLASGTATIAAVASAYGYGSEAAFSRAFLRRRGVRPGAARGKPGR
ncbi:AraC family transcriptional regulator [Caulobacter sp.]|uniref:AraC family transcriptional regulator n=1 Tax=Caulobacter sp. TaxID=78 RepID=UPI002B45C539|nr:AraC family transcriptional regulator [Caulobacter sp.]HJV40873.1 AraC family transcriptional regulator [Caulobacter sp.]